VTLLLIAFASRGYEPCQANGVLRLEPGERSVSCGELDPHPWLYLGIAVTAAGAVTCLAVSRVRR
jgi:hypothetical protein